MQAKPTSSVGRFDGIDRLRGIAALSVVLFHYLYLYDCIWGHDIAIARWTELGGYGVELFFIISGFVIPLSLRRKSMPDFVYGRFIRLYPVYWICVIFTAICIVLNPSLNAEVGISDFLINFTMVQGYLNVPYIDSVYWTLQYELAFYLIIAVSYFSFSKKWWGIVGVMMFVVYCAPLIIYKASTEFGWRIPASVEFLFLLRYGVYFLCGILMNNAFLLRGAARGFSSGLLVLVVVIETIVCWSLFNPVLLLSLLVMASVFYPMKGDRIFLFFGTISYSLYLIHQVIGYAVINFTSLYLDNSMLGVLFAIVLSISLATLLNQTVEAPAQRRLKDWWNRR
ncbi:acyltransferase family protein [Cerasicoccus arenae]|uniref:acyltransferase family protein n=1 Tax=Cerasicoccus arenae TaxID=424488 RepID=UPI001675D6F4|nr:acyltransferase [Cerasicoccus arenae]MBK1859690.1 acyltransferase [Cerasicoccus arenae]